MDFSLKLFMNIYCQQIISCQKKESVGMAVIETFLK